FFQEETMPLSLSDEQTIEGLLENLPLDYQQTAIESKAFLRARKIKSPMELMHLVMMYCGVDQVLREVAGNVTLLNEKITDTAIQKRLRACGPWLKMILEQMWFSGVTKLPGALRFVLVDGSSLSVAGANGTSYRLHIAIDLVSLSIVHIEVTDKYVGESLAHYPFIEGDVVIVDRGYNQPQEIINITEKGILIVLRLNPYSMRLFCRRRA
ncbi:MAG: transposase, partial [Methyloprofundus sp.]|nr:transposase [Methyloprofundus sp.]